MDTPPIHRKTRGAGPQARRHGRMDAGRARAPSHVVVLTGPVANARIDGWRIYVVRMAVPCGLVRNTPCLRIYFVQMGRLTAARPPAQRASCPSSSCGLPPNQQSQRNAALQVNGLGHQHAPPPSPPVSPSGSRNTSEAASRWPANLCRDLLRAGQCLLQLAAGREGWVVHRPAAARQLSFSRCTRDPRTRASGARWGSNGRTLSAIAAAGHCHCCPSSRSYRIAQREWGRGGLGWGEAKQYERGGEIAWQASFGTRLDSKHWELVSVTILFVDDDDEARPSRQAWPTVVFNGLRARMRNRAFSACTPADADQGGLKAAAGAEEGSMARRRCLGQGFAIDLLEPGKPQGEKKPGLAAPWKKDARIGSLDGNLEGWLDGWMSMPVERLSWAANAEHALKPAAGQGPPAVAQWFQRIAVQSEPPASCNASVVVVVVVVGQAIHLTPPGRSVETCITSLSLPYHPWRPLLAQPRRNDNVPAGPKRQIDDGLAPPPHCSLFIITGGRRRRHGTAGGALGGRRPRLSTRSTPVPCSAASPAGLTRHHQPADSAAGGTKDRRHGTRAYFVGSLRRRLCLCLYPASARLAADTSWVPSRQPGVSFLVFLSLLCPFYEGSCVRFKVWLGLFFIFILGWLDVTQASEPRRRNKGTTAAARPRKMIHAAENGNRKKATSLAESQPPFVRGQHTRTRAWLTESAAGPATKPPSQPPRHCYTSLSSPASPAGDIHSSTPARAPSRRTPGNTAQVRTDATIRHTGCRGRHLDLHPSSSTSLSSSSSTSPVQYHSLSSPPPPPPSDRQREAGCLQPTLLPFTTPQPFVSTRVLAIGKHRPRHLALRVHPRLAIGLLS
ncbi:hypothetical protein Purlil1_1893 [Purpureocillium lilacinum]|uniref:Uncharacterized protein n=1 Tax=Purpureocillium lilacinum TaxID=33203 RepID=A0ABR0CB97_PURLI|nr:hypothetical protein Purlil1_1893 [Purpureocillium lilacinum]